jgi:hypothetical protein
MRRILAAMAVGTVFALSACTGLPSGVDGDLVNSWQAMPEPKSLVPHAGDCYTSTASDLVHNKAIPCTESHDVEVTYVGDLGATAIAGTAPNAAAIAAAYKKCYAPTNSYLGGEWHGGLVELTVAVPDTAAFGGGARWFRCDVRATNGVYLGNDEVKSLTTSLKGALRTRSALTLQCVTWKETSDSFVNNIVTSSCKKFSGEYVGFVDSSSATFPKDEKAREKLFSDACSAKVARYLGVSLSNYHNQTVGWLWMSPEQDNWTAGDHSTRCFAAAFTSSHYFTASVKGIGNKNAKG